MQPRVLNAGMKVSKTKERICISAMLLNPPGNTLSLGSIHFPGFLLPFGCKWSSCKDWIGLVFGDAAQAGLTDRAPIHVLGGHIIPLGPEGANLTSVARTGPLTLLVALARRPVTAQSCLPELCKNTYNLNPRERQAYACGHMYLDDGEQVKLDDGKGAHIYFTAFAAYNEANGHVEGQVVVEYDPAVPDTACGTPEWPPVTKVIIFNIPLLARKYHMMGMCSMLGTTAIIINWTETLKGSLRFLMMLLSMTCHGLGGKYIRLVLPMPE
eukprot:jgi/Botrbrau1/7084/Bobra.0165s0106.1